MSRQGLKEQFNTFKHFSSRHFELQAGIKRLPTECCLLCERLALTKVKTFLENWAKKGKPTVFLSSQSTTSLLSNDVLKTHSLKNGMQIKGFLWVCCNGVQLDQPIKHYEGDILWVLVFCTPPSTLAPAPLTAHTSICLKISWPVASHRGSKALVKHNAMHSIDLSAIKNKQKQKKTTDLDNYAFFCINVPVVNNADQPL